MNLTATQWRALDYLRRNNGICEFLWDGRKQSVMTRLERIGLVYRIELPTEFGIRWHWKLK